MKNLISFLYVFLLISSCSNDDSGKTELQKLPPATQIGAQTFACLVDGKAFYHKNRFLDNIVYSRFEHYYFMSLSKRNPEIEAKTVQIYLDLNQIHDIGEYAIGAPESSPSFGRFILPIESTTTDANHTGKLTITKFDDQIISGTFWYDIMDAYGEKREIREGRFDIKYKL